MTGGSRCVSRSKKKKKKTLQINASQFPTQVYHINIRQAPRIRAAVPVQTPISHCNVENLTASTRSRKPATSCSMRVSVSLIRISWLLASSRMRPFSRLRSSRTEACVRPISSRSRELSFARSAAIFSCEERVSWASVESAFRSSERSLAKSTFCVYVDLSESIELVISWG